MKVLLIDNYDSFTYNLFQIVAEILTGTGHLDVVRNDELTIEEIKQRNYDRIIISPGPGSPDDSAYFGVCTEVLKQLAPRIPVLGVCLGLQGLAYALGGKIVRARVPMHGKVSPIQHDGRGVFQGLPQGLMAMRYHSLVVDPNSVPSSLEVSATALDDLTGTVEIMGLRHKEYPLEGIQFHPESFATEGGVRMISNFISQKR